MKQRYKITQLVGDKVVSVIDFIDNGAGHVLNGWCRWVNAMKKRKPDAEYIIEPIDYDDPMIYDRPIQQNGYGSRGCVRDRSV